MCYGHSRGLFTLDQLAQRATSLEGTGQGGICAQLFSDLREVTTLLLTAVAAVLQGEHLATTLDPRNLLSIVPIFLPIRAACVQAAMTPEAMHRPR